VKWCADKGKRVGKNKKGIQGQKHQRGEIKNWEKEIHEIL